MNGDRRNLHVEFGMVAPTGFGWSHSSRSTSRVVHVQRDGTDSPYVAVCGRECAGNGPEFLSGDLCRRCADACGIGDVAELGLIEDEHRFVADNRLGVRPQPVVDGDPSPPAVSEPQAQPEPAEITPEIAAGIVQVLGDLERAAIAEIADVPHVVVTVDPEVLASDSGGVRRALPSARGPYPDRASARRAAREIAESLNAAIGGDVPFVCVAVPLATPAGEPWSRSSYPGTHRAELLAVKR